MQRWRRSDAAQGQAVRQPGRDLQRRALGLALGLLLTAGCTGAAPPVRPDRPTPTPTPTLAAPTPTPEAQDMPTPGETTTPLGSPGWPLSPTPGGVTPLPPTPSPAVTLGPSPEPAHTAAPAGAQPVVERVAGGLDFPLTLAFLPDGRLLVGEKAGRVRVVERGRLREEPLLTVDVASDTEAGLLGLAVYQDSLGQPYLYAYYSYRGEGGLRNRVARGRLLGDRPGPEEVVLEDIPGAPRHNGGVIAFAPDGTLYITTGDAEQWDRAQDPDTLQGKVLRVEPAGAVPADNPFPGSPVYALGVRNAFGLAFHPATGRGYFTDNMVDRADELNLLAPAGNYGWPEVVGRAGEPAYVDPLLDFTPTTAPTLLVFVRGTRYPERYRGALLMAEWNTGALKRIALAPPAYDRVVAQEVVLKQRCCLIALAQGPDGYLYYTTADGVYRIVSLPPTVGAPTPWVRGQG